MMQTTEAAWSNGEMTEETDVAQDVNNTRNTHDIRCEDNYIPTVAEYTEAMGVYQTVLLAVGGTASVVLYLLFFTQVYRTLRHVDKRFRKHVLWLTSVCPFMTLMSVVSVIVPRADTACTAFKVTYLSLGMSHFMDMTTAMFGNEKVMLAQLSNERFNLHVGPACYCCLCLPSPTVTRDRLRWVRWLLWQMPYTQAFYFMMQIIWSTAKSDALGRLDPNFSLVWLSSLSFVTIMAGIYGLQITSALCLNHLDHYSYQKKSFAIKLLVMASQLQSFTLDVLSLFKVYPCMSPMLSPRVFKQTLENTLYLPEMLLIGIFTWRTYWTKELDPENANHYPSNDPRFSMDKGFNPIPKIDFFTDIATFPSPPRSSISSYYSAYKGSCISFIPPSNHPSRCPTPRNSLYPPESYLHPSSTSSSPHLRPHRSSSLHPPSSPSPPLRPPRSSRSSSICVPTHSSPIQSGSSSPVPSHSTNHQVSPDSCTNSESPTSPSFSLPPYAPTISISPPPSDEEKKEVEVRAEVEETTEERREENEKS